MSVRSNRFMTGDVYVNSVEFLKKEKTKFEKVIFGEFLLDVGKNMVLPITFECGTVFKTVDFIEDTSGVIVGQSGIGKTYLLNNIIKQWAMTTSPDELQLILFSKHKASVLKDVGKLPHVLGLEDDLNKFEQILDGILEEIELRKDYLDNKGMSNVRLNNKKSEEKIPNLVFIIDDLTSVLGKLHDNTDLYKEVKKKLSLISQEGRTFGVRLLISASRSIDTSIPKNVMANSSFKFGMEVVSEKDYSPLGFSKIIEDGNISVNFDKDRSSLKEVGGLSMPKGKGNGLLKTMGEDIVEVSSLEDDTEHNLNDVIKFWDSKGTKEKGYNILSNKLKGIFKD